MPLLKCTDYVPYISTDGLLVVTGPCQITQVHGLRTLHFHKWLAGGYWAMSHHSSAWTTYPTFPQMACWWLQGHVTSLKCMDYVPYISTDGLLVVTGPCHITQVHGQRTLHFQRWLGFVTGPCQITQNYTPLFLLAWCLFPSSSAHVHHAR